MIWLLLIYFVVTFIGVFIVTPYLLVRKIIVDKHEFAHMFLASPPLTKKVTIVLFIIWPLSFLWMTCAIIWIIYLLFKYVFLHLVKLFNLFRKYFEEKNAK